jgi:precorrin-2 dehydrogenase/sirohydrochlorin ferrochelatase
MLPILLNLHNRLAVVVGGGQVGRRKARAVLDSGGQARLICLEPPSEELIHPRLDWRQEAYHPGHLDGAFLVFAAGPPALNERVARDAEERGLLVNVASHPERGHVTLPSTLRRGNLTISVSTSGASPSLACRIRERLEADFDDAFADWLDLLAELRFVVKEQIGSATHRHQIMEELSAWHWLDRLRTESRDGVRQGMLAIVEQGMRDSSIGMRDEG